MGARWLFLRRLRRYVKGGGKLIFAPWAVDNWTPRRVRVTRWSLILCIRREGCVRWLDLKARWGKALVERYTRRKELCQIIRDHVKRGSVGEGSCRLNVLAHKVKTKGFGLFQSYALANQVPTDL